MGKASSIGDQSNRKRLFAWLMSAIVTVIAIGAFAVFWLGGGMQERTVADLLESSSEIHPTEATSALCTDPHCVEAWRTNVGDYLRFDSIAEAEYWAEVLGDEGRRWENFVLDLGENDLSRDQRRLAIDILYSWHDWN